MSEATISTFQGGGMSGFGEGIAAGKQAVIGVEGVELAGLEAALKAILQEVRAALIEKHAAFLIDKSLEELQLSFGELDLGGDRSHDVCVRRTARCASFQSKPKEALLGGGDGFRGLLKSFELRAVQQL